MFFKVLFLLYLNLFMNLNNLNLIVLMEYVTPRNVSCPKFVQITIFYFTITSMLFYSNSPSFFMNYCCKNYLLRKMILKILKKSLSLNSLMMMNMTNTMKNHLIKYVMYLLPWKRLFLLLLLLDLDLFFFFPEGSTTSL